MAYTVLTYMSKNHICGGLQLQAIWIAVQHGCGINKPWAWGKNRCMAAFQRLPVLQLEQLFTASSFWLSLFAVVHNSGKSLLRSNQSFIIWLPHD